MTNCRYCGQVMGSDDRAYCGDVCLFASGQVKVIQVERYGLHLRVDAPIAGWVYGEVVNVQYQGWVIEIKPALGGHTLTRVRTQDSRTGLIVVEKPHV